MSITIYMYKEHEFIVLSILGTAIALFVIPTMTANHVLAVITPFALQDTKISGSDPIPGHQMHQAVVILPPRNDTKIYSGTLTFSSSHPVELIVSHPFNLTQTPENNATFIPEPLTVPGQNTALAILHEIGQGVQFDTIPFAGSSLSLHNRAGQNFTVSYSVAGDLMDATGIPK
jgi:hypothetical protein